MLKFTVPGRPIPKARPRVGKGHTYTPQSTKDYEHEVGMLALNAMPPESRTVPLYADGVVSVTIYFYTNRGDIDNLAKSVLDGLNGVVWSDDDQITSLFLYKNRCAKGEEHAEIRVTWN